MTNTQFDRIVDADNQVGSQEEAKEEFQKLGKELNLLLNE